MNAIATNSLEYHHNKTVIFPIFQVSIFGGRYAKQLEDTGEGAIVAASIDVDRLVSRQRFPPQAEAAHGIPQGA